MTAVNGQLSAYVLNNGNGTFQPPVDAPVLGTDAATPFIRDLDGDSRMILAMPGLNSLTRQQAVKWFYNTNATTNCSLPAANQLVAHICAPTSGQIVGQTFTFIGSGSALNGIAKRVKTGKKSAPSLVRTQGWGIFCLRANLHTQSRTCYT